MPERGDYEDDMPDTSGCWCTVFAAVAAVIVALAFYVGVKG